LRIWRDTAVSAARRMSEVAEFVGALSVPKLKGGMAKVSL